MKRPQCLIALATVAVFARSTLAVVRNVPTATYPTIQSAIDACSAGDVVVVADGTYSTPGNVNLDFKGLDIVVRSSGGASKCIIDCLNSPSTRGFQFVTSEPPTAVLRGFTIRNGNVSNAAGTGYGGGILVNSGRPFIYQCIIEDCDANSGGGLSVRAGGGAVLDCVIRRNTASNAGSGPDAKGGGVELQTSYWLVRSTIESNVASVPATGSNTSFGGGVYTTGPSAIVTMRGVTIRNNHAIGRSVVTCWGGGVFVGQFLPSSLTKLESCTLTGNRAMTTSGGYGGGGGAISARGDTKVLRSRLESNFAGSGGAVYTEVGLMWIEECVIRGNTAQFAGGTYNSPTAPLFTIANSLITDNSATAGGGAMLGASGRITSSTITRNFSPNGGGLQVVGTGCLLENSIVCSNVGSAGTQIQVTTGFPADLTVRHSDVWRPLPTDATGTITYAPGCISANPLFVSPAGADGVPGTIDDNFRLAAGSPCIDAGNNALILFGVTRDLAGAGRRADDPAKPDTGAGGFPVVDMGAYERFGEFPWARSARTASPATN